MNVSCAGAMGSGCCMLHFVVVERVSFWQRSKPKKLSNLVQRWKLFAGLDSVERAVDVTCVQGDVYLDSDIAEDFKAFAKKFGKVVCGETLLPT
eukprot:1996793-Amphidinium_carterae.1